MRRALTILGVLSLLTTLLAAGPATAQKRTQQGIRIVKDGATDAPAFVTGLNEPPRRGRPAELALSHLSANRSLYEIDAPAADLDVISVERGDDSSTVRFQQLYDGVEVFGAHYLVHFDEKGAGREVTAVNGDFFTNLNTSVKARISESSARKLALARQRIVKVERVESHGLVVLPEGDGVTAFSFTVWGHGPRGPVKQEVFISALTGATVLSYNDLHRADPVGGSGVTVHGDTVDLSLSQDDIVSPYEMRGFLDPNEDPPPEPPDMLPLVAIETHDAEGEDGLLFETGEESLIEHTGPHFDGAFSDIGAVDAHWGTERVFEFYKSLGRNSINGVGGPIVSIVNAGDAGDAPMYNAFWDGTNMVYGNPEPNPITREVYPFSADLDVVAHELTHGVIDHSSKLVYLNQSGAMNEAYADYFGNAVDVTISGTPMDDPDAGEIAEDLCRVPHPDNLECPSRDLNIVRDVEDFGFYLVDFDNGGVHFNSTIFSGALWDIREGMDPAFADQIMYRALTRSAPLDDFVDGRIAVLAAAAELGATPEELAVITEAFDLRGITNGWDDAPGESDSVSLLEDVSPLGFYNAAPQVSGSRYVVGTYADKELMFEEPQEIVVGNVTGSNSPVKVNNDEVDVLYHELPDISGQEVVWARGKVVGGGRVTFDVVKRKLGGGMRTIADTSALEWFPSIDGNLIAWERVSSTGTDIWARRIGGLPKRITKGGGADLYPQVSGTKVAWWDNRADRFGIKDFKTGKKTIIRHSNPNAYLGPPALNDTHVFWFQDVNNDGFGSIMRAKLNGKSKKTLVRESNKDIAPFYGGITPEPPRISANGKFLVYVDEYGYDRASEPENIGRDVWHMRVTGGTPRVVTCNRGDQGYASIGSGQRAVWLDGSLGRTDLMTRARPPSTCQRTLTRG